jgi:hypothetical protein
MVSGQFVNLYNYPHCMICHRQIFISIECMVLSWSDWDVYFFFNTEGFYFACLGWQT